jgi:hypothetical protein
VIVNRGNTIATNIARAPCDRIVDWLPVRIVGLPPIDCGEASTTEETISRQKLCQIMHHFPQGRLVKSWHADRGIFP